MDIQIDRSGLDDAPAIAKLIWNDKTHNDSVIGWRYEQMCSHIAEKLCEPDHHIFSAILSNRNNRRNLVGYTSFAPLLLYQSKLGIPCLKDGNHTCICLGTMVDQLWTRKRIGTTLKKHSFAIASKYFDTMLTITDQLSYKSLKFISSVGYNYERIYWKKNGQPRAVYSVRLNELHSRINTVKDT